MVMMQHACKKLISLFSYFAAIFQEFGESTVVFINIDMQIVSIYFQNAAPCLQQFSENLGKSCCINIDVQIVSIESITFSSPPLSGGGLII